MRKHPSRAHTIRKDMAAVNSNTGFAFGVLYKNDKAIPIQQARAWQGADPNLRQKCAQTL